MEVPSYVVDTVLSIANAYVLRGVDVTVDKVKEIIETILQKNPEYRDLIDLDNMARKIHKQAGHVGREAYNKETLARYLEIPLPDLEVIKPENLELNVLINHVKLEGEFQKWLNEWGYQDVQSGMPLEGLYGIEFMPDVYGRLRTLHGEFEICISLVCDSPPSEDRVFGLLGKLSAYGSLKKSFSKGDVFAVVTHDNFTQSSINAISMCNAREEYSIIPLDGGDLHSLESAENTPERLDILFQLVKAGERVEKEAAIR